MGSLFKSIMISLPIYTFLIKNKSRFRYNRLKCRDCERDDPISRILRNSRVRIMSCLKTKNHHLIEYLGCNGNNYYKWLKYSNDNFEINIVNDDAEPNKL